MKTHTQNHFEIAAAIQLYIFVTGDSTQPTNLTWLAISKCYGPQTIVKIMNPNKKKEHWNGMFFYLYRTESNVKIKLKLKIYREKLPVLWRFSVSLLAKVLKYKGHKQPDSSTTCLLQPECTTQSIFHQFIYLQYSISREIQHFKWLKFGINNFTFLSHFWNDFARIKGWNFGKMIHFWNKISPCVAYPNHVKAFSSQIYI